MNSRDLLNTAYEFAKEKHNATKKLYNGEPYIRHPIFTASIVSTVAPDDNNLIVASYLHDILEDTDVSYEELRHLFGADIANLVQEVTKDENKNFPNIKTERGLILKVADRLANVASAKNNTDKQRKKKLFKKYSFCFIHEGSHLKNG